MLLHIRPCALAIALGAALFACAAPAPTLAPPLPYEPPRVDVLDYDVSVDLDHLARRVTGHVDVTFAALADRPATELVLDAVEMSIARATDDQGDELPFAYDGRRLTVTLAAPLPPGATGIVGVDYACSPRKGLYFVAPSAIDPDRPWQIWTQGQAQDTRYWVPVWDQLDDRATHSLHVTVDDDFITMAAGTQTGSVRDSRVRRTDSWRMDTPHPTSLMTVVAGGFAVEDLPGGPLPLPVVVEPAGLARARVALAPTRTILDFYADYTACPYPYRKYAQCLVKEFTAGGMENISATTLFHEMLAFPEDKPQIDAFDLVAHEAAHMWFGDLVGCRDWGHIWLNEGFATYLTALCAEHLGDLDDFRQTMLANQRGAVAAEDAKSRPIVTEDWTDPDELFDDHAYPGGASRLHLLAEALGPDVFRRGVQRYVAEHAAGIVVTDDLKAALEAESGSDLDRFFEQWLTGAGYPCFELRLAGGGAPEGARRLLVTQTQGRRGWREVFRVPVTVAWSRGGVESSRRVLVERERVAVELPGEGPLDWVRFDATTSLPARFDLEQGEAMWAAQLAHASDGVTRLLAAQWFAGDPAVLTTPRGAGWTLAPSSRQALTEAARHDKLAAVRATALHALAAVPAAAGEADDCAQLALELEKETDPLVREAAVAALGTHGDELVVPLLVFATRDANSSVAAAALGALAERGYPRLFAVCQEVADRTKQYQLDEAVVNLVSGLQDEPQSLDFLLAAARSEPVPAVRATALRALALRPDPDGAIGRLLVEALGDDSHVVRAAAASVLGARGDQLSDRQLQARLEVESDVSVRAALLEALR